MAQGLGTSFREDVLFKQWFYRSHPMLDKLVETAKRFDNMEIVRKMKEIVPEYRSNNSVYEVLDK